MGYGQSKQLEYLENEMKNISAYAVALLCGPKLSQSSQLSPQDHWHYIEQQLTIIVAIIATVTAMTIFPLLLPWSSTNYAKP